MTTSSSTADEQALYSSIIDDLGRKAYPDGGQLCLFYYEKGDDLLDYSILHVLERLYLDLRAYT